jgi:hypothetical protein
MGGRSGDRLVLMATKTYALLDMIGVKERLRSADASGVHEFWSAADAWTNGVGNSLPPKPLPGGHAMQVPEVCVVTFSDSALLFTRPEFDLEVFYEILGSLKQHLSSRAGHVYCVVSRGEEIAHHQLPALGMNSLGSDLKPHYFNVAGTGRAWVNLHLADRAVTRHKTWHGQFSLYCVDAESKPPSIAARDQLTFRDFDDNDRLVLALT